MSFFRSQPGEDRHEEDSSQSSRPVVRLRVGMCLTHRTAARPARSEYATSIGTHHSGRLSFHARIELAAPVTGVSEGTGVGLAWEPGSTLLIEKGEAKVQPPPEIDHDRGQAPESSVKTPISGGKP